MIWCHGNRRSLRVDSWGRVYTIGPRGGVTRVWAFQAVDDDTPLRYDPECGFIFEARLGVGKHVTRNEEKVLGVKRRKPRPYTRDDWGW